jgi:serine/threonine protein kinase
MQRKVIGEGSYGCVHQPSIHCKTLPKPGFNYDNYVSKLMKTKNAQDELAEFVFIQNIDPTNEYHLDKPILCKPNFDDTGVKKSIGECKYIKLTDVQANPDNYSLLVMKNGGMDLTQFCQNGLVKYLEKNKEEKVDNFWIEVHNLLKGLKFFKDHAIVHNDLKPQNILIDEHGKMKFIDFGLMRNKKDIIQTSNSNTNFLGIYHWSYPFDCAFMNKLNYDEYKNSSENYKQQYRKSLSSLIIGTTKNNSFNLPIKHPSAFSILFSYINAEFKIPNATTQYAYIKSFFQHFNKIINLQSYDDVLDRIIDSIDIFGLGFSLQYITNCFKKHNAINLEDFTRLSFFFKRMYNFNISEREIDINRLIDDYEIILLEMGILTKYSKAFDNHVLINKSPAPTFLKKVKTPEHLTATLQKIADQDPVLLHVYCPPEKELNPNTGNCVKKCKPGFIRNDQFLCRKNTTKKNKLTTCPPEKELNPNTGNCVKKCKPGFVRNDQFLCRKNTTKKSKSNIKSNRNSNSNRNSKSNRNSTRNSNSKSKRNSNSTGCPPEKELNPNTGNCVKKCKPGFIRNDKFQCKKNTTKNPDSIGCPPEKELNPNTGNCVKKCQPGFVRNDKFQCRKNINKN